MKPANMVLHLPKMGETVRFDNVAGKTKRVGSEILPESLIIIQEKLK
jgi:hypothetical protein